MVAEIISAIIIPNLQKQLKKRLALLLIRLTWKSRLKDYRRNCGRHWEQKHGWNARWTVLILQISIMTEK